MTKREVRKIAKRSIADGKSKQDTFNDLNELKKIPMEDLAQIIKKISSFKVRSKYRILNYILIILLSLTIALRILAAIPEVLEKGLTWLPVILILPAIYILILIGVASYNYGSYLLISILAILGLLGVLLNYSTYDSLLLYFADILYASLFSFLVLFLKAKLFPLYQTKKEIYQNEFGENRMRYVFQFED